MGESLDNFQNTPGKTPGLVLEGWMLDMKEISLQARVLFGLLSALARKRGYAWPSQKFLADRLGVSRRTVNSLLGELKRAELVDVDQPAPGRSTCRYRPKTQPGAARANRCPGVGNGGGKHLHMENKKGVFKKNTPLPPKGGRRGVGSPAPFLDYRLTEFEACFQTWPLKQNRKSALRTWKRLIRADELPEPGRIAAVIRVFKAKDAFWQRSKVPQFGRWLRGRRWEDQPYISPLTSPPYPPASPGHASPSSPEMRARAQLALLRTAVSSGVVDPAMDALTRKIMDGHGGLHGLRTLPQREVGFALNGFVKAYLGLLNLKNMKTPSGLTPMKNGPDDRTISAPALDPGPCTVSARLLEAVNRLSARFPARRVSIFEACRALDSEARLPDPDELERLSQSLNEPPDIWLRREFGKNKEMAS